MSTFDTVPEVLLPLSNMAPDGCRHPGLSFVNYFREIYAFALFMHLCIIVPMSPTSHRLNQYFEGKSVSIERANSTRRSLDPDASNGLIFLVMREEKYGGAAISVHCSESDYCPGDHVVISVKHGPSFVAIVGQITPLCSGAMDVDFSVAPEEARQIVSEISC